MVLKRKQQVCGKDQRMSEGSIFPDVQEPNNQEPQDDLAHAESVVPGISPGSYNVFRHENQYRRDRISRHKRWLNSIVHECPMPHTAYRIGVYIRYYNQTKYDNYLDYHKKQFEDTISLCPKWELVDFYVDEGMSAPSMENAKEWCRLLNDCFTGRVNLIVTQKVSNVSRKPEELAFISRILAAQEQPVGIYFISEDLFTLASYYRQDLRETGFLPEGWKVLPQDGLDIPNLQDGEKSSELLIE